MSTELKSALAAITEEVRGLWQKLNEHRDAVESAQRRRTTAEQQTAAARLELASLKEEEVRLRAAFLNDPFWEHPYGKPNKLPLPPRGRPDGK